MPRRAACTPSAGGLHALGVILAALPAGFPTSILVVQHLSPDFPSQLARVLGRRTLLHVKQAEQGDKLHTGWVYVAPAGKHLLACADGSLALTTMSRVHHCRPCADVLFKSVAASFGAWPVGVVLTGGDGDGAAGIQAVKAAGGVTFALDLPRSQQPSMPRSAAATAAVDYVLPLADIAAALVTPTGPGRHPDPEREGHFKGETSVVEDGSQAGRSDRDKATERAGARVAGLFTRGGNTHRPRSRGSGGGRTGGLSGGAGGG